MRVNALKAHLATIDPKVPSILGSRMGAIVKDSNPPYPWHFCSGGAGYLVNRAALQLFGDEIMRDNGTAIDNEMVVFGCLVSRVGKSFCANFW